MYPCNITLLSPDLRKLSLSHYESGGGAAETGETGRRFNSDGGKGDCVGGGGSSTWEGGWNDKLCVALFRLVGHKFQEDGEKS